MKKQLFLLLLVVSVCFSVTSNNVSAQLTNAPANAPIDLIQDWRVISILLILISVILVSAAYMAGQAFEMPELKGWAAVELSQVIASALIIAFVFIGIAFIDGLMIVLVENSDIAKIECLPTDDCALKITSAYFDGVESSMNSEVESLLKNAVEAGEKMGRRSGVSGHTLIWPVPTLWASASVAWAPQNILHLERYNTVIEFYSTLFSSMYAQQFFVEDIVPKTAPYLFFLGIIARSFFVTRRLGGLLIAIALGVMIVFPLMYVFDWLTLDITIYGDKSLQADPMPVCPEECQAMPPAAYNTLTDTTFHNANALVKDMENQYKDDYNCVDHFGDPISWAGDYLDYHRYYKPGSFIPEDATELEKNKILSIYGEASVSSTPCVLDFITSGIKFEIDKSYVFCFNEDDVIDPLSLPYSLGDFVTENTFCPISCRELPYPFGKSECNPLQVQWACSNLPAECKVKRTIPQSKIDELSTPYKEKIKKCDAQCKMIPPMKSSCATGAGTITEWINEVHPGEYGLTTVSQCKAINWQIFSKDESELTEDEKDGKSAAKMACEDLYGDKGVFVSADADISGSNKNQFSICYIYCYMIEDECLSLPPECRIRMENEEQDGIISIDDEDMTNDCDEEVVEMCPASLKPEESCVYVVPNYKYWEQCSDCLLINDGFTYDPPIAKDCEQLCSDTNWKKDKISPAQFAVKTREGMVGRSEIKNAASFVVPIYILPLLNILVTLMFIKTFSQILGGDIEIPGLQKVF